MRDKRINSLYKRIYSRSIRNISEAYISETIRCKLTHARLILLDHGTLSRGSKSMDMLVILETIGLQHMSFCLKFDTLVVNKQVRKQSKRSDTGCILVASRKRRFYVSMRSISITSLGLLNAYPLVVPLSLLL